MLIEMRTTTERALRDQRLVEDWHPEERPDSVVISYEVDPRKCRVPLGRWLAGVITSTCIGQPGCLLLVVSPLRSGDVAVLEIMDMVAGYPALRSTDVDASPESLERLLKFKKFMTEVMIELYSKVKCETKSSTFHVWYYEWPVYGSDAFPNASTPEEYLDCVAEGFLHRREVIVEAGDDAAIVPKHLMPPYARERIVEAGESIRFFQMLYHD